MEGLLGVPNSWPFAGSWTGQNGEEFLEKPKKSSLEMQRKLLQKDIGRCFVKTRRFSSFPSIHGEEATTVWDLFKLGPSIDFIVSPADFHSIHVTRSFDALPMH